MPQSILVPTDLSECSRQALRYAYELASKLGARLEVVHVVPPPTYVPLDLAIWGDVRERLVTQLGDELKSFIEETLPAGSNVPMKVTTGVPYDSILHEAERADLVVMGTHGRSGVSRFLMGSVAERVVRAASCPVLTVREATPGAQGSD